MVRRSGIICGPIWGSFTVRGSFAVQFGDHFRSGDHLRAGIICGPGSFAGLYRFNNIGRCSHAAVSVWPGLHSQMGESELSITKLPCLLSTTKIVAPIVFLFISDLAYGTSLTLTFMQSLFRALKVPHQNWHSINYLNRRLTQC